ncbi:unnamed protein product [Cuscuta epithymum]|uniref:Retrotransposon Copia-like N-terminal domain-containing protein n=1 Tax=Cuscuta epithymum TaxID=186058 RepID=A0AAV0D777_9ASTE|nr:unnamed protein product [Cuscuta epithymum]
MSSAAEFSAAISSSSMAAATASSSSSTTAPVSATFTDAAVIITSAAVNLTEPPQFSSSGGSVVHPLPSPLTTETQGTYSLFHAIPSTFPWQTPVLPNIPGSFFSTPLPASTQPTPGYYGSTFSGAPGLSRPPDNSLFQSQMAMVAQSITPANNVTQIVTIELKAVEDYITWRTQFESFLVSQGVFGFLDGSIQVPSMYTVDFNNHQIINTDYYHWLRVDQTIRSWIFATLTRDVLIDVHELKHAFEI